MIACGKGVTNTVLSNTDLMIDFMPVDISIKAMVVAAYHRGIHKYILLHRVIILYFYSENRYIST